MNDYIYLCGTKDKIADDLAEMLSVPSEVACGEDYKRFVYQLVDFIDANHDALLLGDDDFQLDNTHQVDANRGLVSSDGIYFIGLQKATYVIVVAVAQCLVSMSGINPIVAAVINAGIGNLFAEKDMPFIKKFGDGDGHSCVLLECARNKRKGIKDNYYDKMGECINQNIRCSYCVDSVCGLGHENAGRILKEFEGCKILKVRRGKYFYRDTV